MKHLKYITYPHLYLLKFANTKFPKYGLLGLYIFAILMSLIVPFWICEVSFLYFIIFTALYIFSEPTQIFVNNFIEENF